MSLCDSFLSAAAPVSVLLSNSLQTRRTVVTHFTLDVMANCHDRSHRRRCCPTLTPEAAADSFQMYSGVRGGSSWKQEVFLP